MPDTNADIQPLTPEEEYELASLAQPKDVTTLTRALLWYVEHRGAATIPAGAIECAQQRWLEIRKTESGYRISARGVSPQAE